MNTLKKTIILNNNTVKNFNGMAVLTLENKQNQVFATFKMFNIEYNNNLVLGIAQNKKQIFKQSINLINNHSSFTLNNINLDLPISCVLVNNNKTEVVPIVWASTFNNFNNEIMQTFEKLKHEETVQPNTTQTLSTPTIDLNQMFEIDDNIEDVITEEINNNFEVLNDNTLNPIDEELKNLNLGEESFYESMSDQIEDLFNSYPAEQNLEQLIPNSKWVKIDYENDGNYYVLGLIYEDIELKYIAYGVPGTFSENPPNGLNNYTQWLPTNPQTPTTDGYWVMYQNAQTGESVNIDAI